MGAKVKNKPGQSSPYFIFYLFPDQEFGVRFLFKLFVQMNSAEIHDYDQVYFEDLAMAATA